MITTDFVRGAPAWIELGSPDVVAVAEFYGRVLGWEYDGGLFRRDGGTVAAHVPLGAGVWTVCFAVADTGPLRRRTDPQGAEFGVWRARDGAGLDAVSTQGALTWLELHTPAPEAAEDFYRSVFAWEIQTIPGAPGRFCRPAGTGAGRLFGAIVEDPSAYWLPYFELADPDGAASVAEVVVEPYEVDGVGRIAVLADPFGARFGVMRSVTS